MKIVNDWLKGVFALGAPRADEETKQILVAIAKLEENTKTIGLQVESVLRLVGDTSALNELAKSSHKRIDDTIKYTDTEIERLEEEVKELKDNQKWTIRTVAGAILLAIVDKFMI